MWQDEDGVGVDSRLELLRLPVDVLMPILSQLGCRHLARAGMACKRLRSLQIALQNVPAFVSSLARAGTLADAVAQAADAALDRMPATVGFAVLFLTVGPPAEEQHALQTLKKKLPPRTPIVGCSGDSIMGMDTESRPTGVELAFEPGLCSASLLLGHIPNCRPHVFAAEAAPFEVAEGSSGYVEDVEAFREWFGMPSNPSGHGTENSGAKANPKLMLMFCRSNAVETFALTAMMMHTANVAFPGIVVSGGVVRAKRGMLYDDGGQVSSTADTVSYSKPPKTPRGDSSKKNWQRARWVGLVVSSLEPEPFQSPELGTPAASSLGLPTINPQGVVAPIIDSFMSASWAPPTPAGGNGGKIKCCLSAGKRKSSKIFSSISLHEEDSKPAAGLEAMDTGDAVVPDILHAQPMPATAALPQGRKTASAAEAPTAGTSQSGDLPRSSDTTPALGPGTPVAGGSYKKDHGAAMLTETSSAKRLRTAGPCTALQAVTPKFGRSEDSDIVSGLRLNPRLFADSVAVWGLGAVNPRVWEDLEVRIDNQKDGLIEPGCQRLLIENCSGGLSGLLHCLKDLGPAGAPWAALWPREWGSSEGASFAAQLESGAPLAIGWVVDPDEDPSNSTQPLQLWVRAREVNSLAKVLKAARSENGASICCQLLRLNPEETLKNLSFVQQTLRERHPPFRVPYPWPPPSTIPTVVGTSALVMVSCSERGRTAFGQLGFEVGNLCKGVPEVPLVGIFCDGEFGPPPAWGTVGFSFHEPRCPGPASADDGRVCHGASHMPIGAPGHSGCNLQAYTLSIAALSAGAGHSKSPIARDRGQGIDGRCSCTIDGTTSHCTG
eukprot:jgi/Botrbrau1/14212/Bobra.0254s0002.1